MKDTTKQFIIYAHQQIMAEQEQLKHLAEGLL